MEKSIFFFFFLLIYSFNNFIFDEVFLAKLITSVLRKYFIIGPSVIWSSMQGKMIYDFILNSQ
jgi:hypothetical protein